MADFIVHSEIFQSKAVEMTSFTTIAIVIATFSIIILIIHHLHQQYKQLRLHHQQIIISDKIFHARHPSHPSPAQQVFSLSLSLSLSLYLSIYFSLSLSLTRNIIRVVDTTLLFYLIYTLPQSCWPH